MSRKIIVAIIFALLLYSSVSYADYAISNNIYSSGGAVGSSSASGTYGLNYILGQDLAGAPGTAGLYNLSSGRYSVETDSNSDGVPDLWYENYELDPTDEDIADEDSDNDGKTNSEEWLAGTNPTDAGSVFAITSIISSSIGVSGNYSVSSEGSITIEFPSSDSRSYGIYYSENPYTDSMEWTLAQSVAGTGSLLSWTDDGTYTGSSPLAGSVAKRFYKITPSINEIGDSLPSSPGQSLAKTSWYIAEGCTGGSFSEWILLMNSSNTAAEVTMTFMKEDGTNIEKKIIVAPTSRYSVSVNEIVPDASVSTKVQVTNGVEIIVERATYWDSGGVKMAGGHSATGVTTPDYTWYLAEGCTAGDFNEWVLIMNPNSVEAKVRVTFMMEDTPSVKKDITIGANSRHTICVDDLIPSASVSTKVESINGMKVIAERAMYWGAGGLEQIGGHSSKGVTSPESVWYLAEGCTSGSFSEWVLVMNPNSVPAGVKLTFMKNDGSIIEKDIIVGANRRYTVYVNDIVPNDSVSTKVETTNGVDVIVERSMYWDAGGIKWAGGHCNNGVNSPEAIWNLAEGCTSGEFELWVLLMNPSSSQAKVKITFMKEDGATVEKLVTVAPTSRYTVYVNDIVPDASVSTKVESINGVNIIVERAMYWNTAPANDGLAAKGLATTDEGKVKWIGGHCSSGVN